MPRSLGKAMLAAMVDTSLRMEADKIQKVTNNTLYHASAQDGYVPMNSPLFFLHFLELAAPEQIS